MSLIDQLVAQARKKIKTIVFPEGDDKRVVEAVAKLSRLDAVRVVLIGDDVILTKSLTDLDAKFDNIRLINERSLSENDAYLDELYQARKHKGVTREAAAQMLADPLVFACLMVRTGDADACLAGAVNTTAAVIRTALQMIGVEEGTELVSSFFLQSLSQEVGGLSEMIFADCALNIAPDSKQLAEIAKSSVVSAQTLLGIEPKVAFLSFSTNGSGSHEQVDKVRVATEIAKMEMPDIEIIGEVQLDAAIDKNVLKAKFPDSDFVAPANILIFPSVEAGNIGYKLVQIFANAQSIGPILQGLKKPVNDLSRSCSTDEIVATALVTVNQSS